MAMQTAISADGAVHETSKPLEDVLHSTAVTAATAVHDTTELLENILRSLSHEDLVLRLQFVSRKCASVIKDSKVLQKILWYQPQPARFRWRYFETYTDMQTDAHCHLQKVAGSQRLGCERDDAGPSDERKRNIEVLEGLRLNPIIFQHKPEQSIIEHHQPRNNMPGFLGATDVTFRSRAFRLVAYNNFRAETRTQPLMLATQPPLREITISSHGKSAPPFRVQNAKGITVVDGIWALEMFSDPRTELEGRIVVTEDFEDAAKLDEVVFTHRRELWRNHHGASVANTFTMNVGGTHKRTMDG